jgi:hypothetical protein
VRLPWGRRTRSWLRGELKQMTFRKPIDEQVDSFGNGWRFYQKPVRTTEENTAHVYIICVDVGQGQEQDFSVCQVIDISENPFMQVATFRDNRIKPTQFATVVRDLGRYYNNAFLFFEINAEGASVAEIVADEFSYENIIYIFPHKKRGQQISAGYHPRSRLGLKVVEMTKRTGCTGLKSLIESNRLHIMDYDTLHELTRFVSKMNKTKSAAQSYEAETGSHDDTVSPLILLGWLTLQQGFENYIGLSMRTLLTEGHDSLTFDEPMIGIMGDLAQQSVTGKTASGIDIIDDNDFWRNDSPTNWLN